MKGHNIIQNKVKEYFDIINKKWIHDKQNRNEKFGIWVPIGIKDRV
jgi:adenine-specific DNA methylase